MNSKCGRAIAGIVTLLLIGAPAGALASADNGSEPRYVLELAARVPGFALDAVEMTIGGKLTEVPLDAPLRLEMGLWETLAVALPAGSPLRLETEAGFARWDAGGCVIAPLPTDFVPEETEAGETPVYRARVQLWLKPLERAPGIRLTGQGQTVRAGGKSRQEIVVTNPSLMPMQAELRYLPDAARFALVDAGEAGYDERLADGSLCWRLALPAAAWDGRGRVEASSVTVVLDRTVLPLPLGDGFADVRETWKLLGDGMRLSGQWRAQAVAPRVGVALTAGSESASAGDLIPFALRITNSGGASKPLIATVTLPRGFRYEPGEERGGGGLEAAPEALGGVLLWRVNVPAAQRGTDGQVAPAELELRYALRMEEGALNENEGLRNQVFGGWADGMRLEPARVALTAPLITARQSLSVQRAAAGEELTLRTVFENLGAAAGIARWTQEIPAGLVCLPEAGETAPELDERGRLVLEVEVPPSGSSVIEREIRLRVSDSALVNRRGGVRMLFLRGSVNDDALPAQGLNVPCPDIVVRVLAEHAVMKPGALCFMKLQIVNRGAAGAPLLLETRVPDGFAEASDTLPNGASREDAKLTWRVDVPPADAAGPSVMEVTYPLRADELPRDLESRTVAHTADYTVAEGVPQKAVSASTEISRPGPLSIVFNEGALVAVACVLFLGTVAVFLLMLLRREPRE